MGIINAKLRVLDKVDNTADTDKSVAQASIPEGFYKRDMYAKWGNQDGTLITDWKTANLGDIQFRENGSQLNVLIDGIFYQHEGANPVLDSENFASYAATKDHTHNNYLPLTGGTMTGTVVMRNSYVADLVPDIAKNGYVLIAQIKINGEYQNVPIEFEIARRGDNSSTFIYIKFENTPSLDPRLYSFNALGATGSIYINKSATSTWDIYVKKAEPHDHIGILSYHKSFYMNGTEVTFPYTQIDTLPLGYQRVTYTYFPYKTGTIALKEDINTSITDWNTATTSGFYVSAAGASNAPVSDAAITGNVCATGNMIAQTVYPESNSTKELTSYTRKGIKNQKVIKWKKWFISSLTLV